MTLGEAVEEAERNLREALFAEADAQLDRPYFTHARYESFNTVSTLIGHELAFV